MKDENIFTLTTESGFEYKVNENAFNKLEVFEKLVELRKPGTHKIEQRALNIELFDMIIGDEQKAALRAFLKERDGELLITEYEKEINDFFVKYQQLRKK